MTRHGTHKTYCDGCRCDLCRHGHANYMRELRQRPSRTRNRVAAEARARLEAARRYRTEHPDEWRRLVNAEMRVEEQRERDGEVKGEG